MIEQLAYGFPFKPEKGCFGYSTCILINSEKTILFDTGGYNLRGVIEPIINRIDCVVISHLHFDHCSNLDLFVKKTVPIYISKKELEHYTKNKENDLDLFSYFSFIKDNLNIIEVNEEIEISPNVKIIFTCGHTPGHISLDVSNGSDKVILAGDALKSYKDFLGEELYGNAHSKEQYIDTKKKIKSNYNVIYPGHSGIIKDGKEVQKMEVREF